MVIHGKLKYFLNEPKHGTPSMNSSFFHEFAEHGGASILRRLGENMTMTFSCLDDELYQKLKNSDFSWTLFSVNFFDHSSGEMIERAMDFCTGGDEGSPFISLIKDGNEKGKIFLRKSGFGLRDILKWAEDSEPISYLMFDVLGVEKFIQFCWLFATHGHPNQMDYGRTMNIPSVKIENLIF